MEAAEVRAATEESQAEWAERAAPWAVLVVPPVELAVHPGRDTCSSRSNFQSCCHPY